MEGISSYSLHPGLVRTEIFAKSYFKVKEDSSSNVISLFLVSEAP